MGTALFATVFRIVMKWYGNPTAQDVLPRVMDDVLMAWQTGHFVGVAVFRAEDKGRRNSVGLGRLTPRRLRKTLPSMKAVARRNPRPAR